jgi:hypothetical protein
VLEGADQIHRVLQSDRAGVLLGWAAIGGHALWRGRGSKSL